MWINSFTTLLLVVDVEDAVAAVALDALRGDCRATDDGRVGAVYFVHFIWYLNFLVSAL